MDEFLGRLGIQAVNYAMRCGIALTSTFAMQQCSRLLETVNNEPQYAELLSLQRVLDSKIKIVSPALDLIEFKSGRGNVFLGNAAELARTLHRDIVALGKRLEKAAEVEELAQNQLYKMASNKKKNGAEIVGIICDVKALIARIDGDIPLLQLAITASGESLSTALPASISPSRLLQASIFLVVGDTQFSSYPSRPVQIGPSFTLSLYMLFLGHSSTTPLDTNTPAAHRTTKEEVDQLNRKPYGIGPGERKPIWQEVLHKARVRICRTPPRWEFHHGRDFLPATTTSDAVQSDYSAANTSCNEAMHAGPKEEEEFAYHLEIIEDLDDGRMHDYCANTTAYDSMPYTGVREAIPIQQISKLFYTDSGRILNIGSDNSFENKSVLLLKRDSAAIKASKPMSQAGTEADDEDEGLSTSEFSDEQAEIDRQLHKDSYSLGHANGADGAGCTGDEHQQHKSRRLATHLDPEWLAFEVFEEDNNSQQDGASDGDEEADTADNSPGVDNVAAARNGRTQHGLVDAHLMEQMHNITISGPTTPSQCQTVSTSNTTSDINTCPTPERPKSHTTQSPFGPVVTSLSLLEMLVRLTSLQQFQQTMHLSIPDHILAFFLEETSATGLKGEERWKAKRAAEQRMGFDPFTDTPSKAQSGNKATL